MALTQSLATSWKSEVLQGLHNFTNGAGGGSASTGNAFKIALFKATASIVGTYNAATTNFSAMSADENAGTNYTAGGNTLTNVTPTSSGTTAYLSFSNTTWPTATITARGAMIYNSTAGNRCVCVLDFGSDQSSSAGNFTIQFPTAGPGTAIINIA